MNISDKILALSAELGPKKKDLADQTNKLEDLTKQITDTDDPEIEETLLSESEDLTKSVDTLTGEVENLEKKLDSFRAIEKRQIAGAKPAQAPAVLKRDSLRDKPADSIVRMGVVKALAHIQRKNEHDLAAEMYPDDLKFKAVWDYTQKTAAPIATTTGATYAAALVDQEIGALLEEVESTSVAAALARRAQAAGGQLLNFGGANSVRVPVLAPTGASPTEPAWVMEGGAIPIGSLSISSTLVNKYKLAEILTTTLELKERSVVDIEALFRRAMTRAYSRVLDNAILDTSSAVAGVRPAGLRSTAAAPGGNGATTATGNATGGVASVTADISAMVGALLGNNQGAVPVLLMNNQDRMSLSFVTSALGEFMFQDQLGAGQVLGVPVVSSAHVPAGTVVMVDVSSLAMVLDVPMFDVSQVATVVEADAGPAGTAVAPTMADDGSGAVGTSGQVQDGIPVRPPGATTPAVAAGYQARSLWQTYSEGVRMIAPTAFIMMRSGVVTSRTAINWK